MLRHGALTIQIEPMCASLSDTGTTKHSSPLNWGPNKWSKLCRATLISVVESADFRKLHHFSEFWRLYPPRDGRVFLQGKMRACFLIVFEISLQDAMQTGFIQNDDVIQTLAADRSDQPLDVR